MSILHKKKKKDTCPETSDGEHVLHLKDHQLVLRKDPIIGVVADVFCQFCRKTGAVRLHWEEVDWDEPAE